MAFDQNKMYKLRPGDRFFDINEAWSFPNRWVVPALVPLPVTANQITLLSLVLGVTAAGFYVWESAAGLVGGAVFLYGKIFLDNVDGNLARVRGEVSRFGRFLDSLTDFIVTVLVYSAVTWRVVRDTGDPAWAVLGGLALGSCLLQCSYFVYYLVSYTSRVGSYSQNRVEEQVTAQDEAACSQGTLSQGSLLLQRIHVWVYGWQDRAVARLDRSSRQWARLLSTPSAEAAWYADKRFLALAGPLCLCTNHMVLVVFSLFDRLALALALVFFLGNGYLAALQVWKIFRHRVRRKAA